MLDKAEAVLSALPLRGRSAELAGKVEESRELVDRASIYVELYGAYTECEAIYGVDRLLGLLAPDAAAPAPVETVDTMGEGLAEPSPASQSLRTHEVAPSQDDAAAHQPTKSAARADTPMRRRHGGALPR